MNVSLVVALEPLPPKPPPLSVEVAAEPKSSLVAAPPSNDEVPRSKAVVAAESSPLVGLGKLDPVVADEASEKRFPDSPSAIV